MNPIIYWTVKGNVRGFISKHRVEDRAHLRAIKDRKQCKARGGGAYSDAKVYARHRDGSTTGPYPTPEHLLDRT